MVVLRVNKKIPHRGKYFGGLDVFLRRPDSLTESPGLIQCVALPVPLSKAESHEVGGNRRLRRDCGG